MKHKLPWLLLPLLLLCLQGRADVPAETAVHRVAPLPSAAEHFFGGEETRLKRPSPLLQIFREKQRNSKKIVAATLAFPLPFGIVGLHRIYLGSAPYVPVAYIASLGGMFGVLPFIDFCVLLAAKKTEPYINNKKIFMWVE